MPAIIPIGRRPDPPRILNLIPRHPRLAPSSIPAFLSIDSLTAAARLAQLYQMAFPGQPELLEREIDLASEESLCQAAANFLERVGDELFPVDWDVWFELGELDWCLYNIPIACQGFAAGYDDPADYPEPICLFLRLAEGQFFGSEDDEPLVEAYPQFVDVPGAVLDNIDRLSEPLRNAELAGPLVALPGLIDMAFQQTGNPWLDVSPEMHAESGEIIPWEAETIADLAGLWRAARPTLEGVWALAEWVSESPAERLSEVISTLLNASIRKEWNDE
jgi:hypothetical protein